MKKSLRICNSVASKWKETGICSHTTTHCCSSGVFAVQRRTFQHSTVRWQTPLQDARETSIFQSPFPDLTFTDKTLSQLIWERSEKWMDKPATVCGMTGRSNSFEDIYNKSKSFAKALLSIGLKPGDVVGVLLPNIPEYAITLLGVLDAGLVLTTINPLYTKEEVNYQILDSRTLAIITMPTFKESLPASGVKHVILIGENDDMPSGNNIHSFNHLVSQGEKIGPSSLPRVDIDAVALLPYSSGTTGKPKGVMLNHRSLTTNLIQRHYPDIVAVRQTKGDSQDNILGVLPFFHIYGMQAVLLSGLYFGSKVILLPKFEPQLFLDCLKSYKINILYLVPPLMAFLAAHPAVQSEHLAHLHSAVCAAAPISASSVDLFLKKTDGKVLYQEAYGMTEASPLVAMDHVEPSKRKPGSCGPPIPNTKVKIVDTGTGETVKPGNTGEVCVQGPQVMMGYLNNPKATTETVDAEEWMRSGDLGYCDEQGYIYITDRIKELIKVKGFQVAPAELEEVLRTHPGVLDAAVVGVPDERSGEVPRAFVVRSDPSITEANISKYVKSRVAPFKRLSGGVVFLDSIPKTASGKILRRVLKKSAM